MPKNKGKGGKNRRRGKNENEGVKRELVFKEDGQEYAQVRVLSPAHDELSPWPGHQDAGERASRGDVL